MTKSLEKAFEALNKLSTDEQNEFARLIIDGIEKKSTDVNLIPKSIKQFNTEIDQALKDSEQDNVIKATDLKSKVKKWE